MTSSSSMSSCVQTVSTVNVTCLLLDFSFQLTVVKRSAGLNVSDSLCKRQETASSKVCRPSETLLYPEIHVVRQCDAVLLGLCVPTFRRNVIPSFAGFRDHSWCLGLCRTAAVSVEAEILLSPKRPDYTWSPWRPCPVGTSGSVHRGV